MEFHHIGKRVKYFRERAGLTQAELAEQVGKTAHHITQIERGIVLPSLPMFYDIAKVLGVPTDSFFMDHDELCAQSVSYTHLDVYKRQVPMPSDRASMYSRSDKGWQRTASPQAPSTADVDVYKRQPRRHSRPWPW